MFVRISSGFAVLMVLATLVTGVSAQGTAGGVVDTPTVTALPTSTNIPTSTSIPTSTNIPTSTTIPTSVPTSTLIPTATGILTLPDLRLSVLANPNPANSNQPVSFLVSVTNAGGTVAAGTRMSVAIAGPVGGSFVGTACSVTAANGALSCPGTSMGSSCFLNSTTGVVSCGGTAQSSNCSFSTAAGTIVCSGNPSVTNVCTQDPTTGAMICSDSTTGTSTGAAPLPSSCNVSNGNLICTGGNGSIPAGCSQDPMTGAFNCSGTGSTIVGASCAQTTVVGTLDCAIPSLPAGASTTLAITGQPVTVGGVLTATFQIDPGNLVAETNESNNSATASVSVSASFSSVPSGSITTNSGTTGTTDSTTASQPAPSVPEVIAAPAPPVAPEVAAPPAPAPAEVAGVQATNPAQVAQPQGQAWLNILAPTQMFSVDMAPLWIAQPGEWYYVVEMEAGWALVVWEGDSAEWTEWVPVDDRTALVITDRPVPMQPNFLVIQLPTIAYSVTMEPLYEAQPGEIYQIRMIESGWALAIWEGASPDEQVWIQIDPSVEPIVE
jgi:hypothetical protein